MHRGTVALYERQAGRYEARRRAHVDPARAEAFAATVPAGGLRVDLGCGPGLLAPALGAPLVGLDAAFAMLVRARANGPGLLAVQADLGLLPFRPQSVAGAWARCSYVHVPRPDLPVAMSELHRALPVGAPVVLTFLRVVRGSDAAARTDDFPGRFFADWTTPELVDVIVGGGFEDVRVDEEEGRVEVSARRARSLPDTVGPSMRVLVCGLNPSLHAADAGVGYSGPSNRFWPAAVEAGLVTRPLDPRGALEEGMGMTDLVKRATRRAAELSTEEFEVGAARVGRLVGWLRPRTVCFVGLAGYRLAVDRRAGPGWQPEDFGGVPTYVMPSTSGLNTGTTRTDLVEHLRAVERSTR